jgi:hypothetical protein
LGEIANCLWSQQNIQGEKIYGNEKETTGITIMEMNWKNQVDSLTSGYEASFF